VAGLERAAMPLANWRETMNYFNRMTLRTTVLAVLLVGSTVAAAETIDIYKTTGCECCSKWAEHLRNNGFETRVHETDELHAIKTKFGVPNEVASCHTGKVGNYFFEGHVPADLMQMFLKERPKARGLAVPGMPAGSPGMEGALKVDYPVLLIKPAGDYTVYAQR
jgi:hypothetical protein